MTRDGRFWRNVTIIALLHVAVLLGLLWWSRTPARAPNDIVWMEGGAGSAGGGNPEPVSEATPLPAMTRVETPNEPEETPTPEVIATPKSEIEVPSVTPSETPKPTPTATPKRTPTPTPRPTPKHTPRPKPSATPKKKATPKPKPTPDEAAEKETARKKALAKKALAKKEKETSPNESPDESPNEKKTAAESGKGETKEKAGGGGHGSGEGGASEFGWYGNMLQDRFHSEWIQPTSVVHSADLTVLLQIRIQKNGRISDYSIVKSSGNAIVDDSVIAAAKRVTQVDPLPAGLGDDYYEVNINFILTSGQ